LSFRQHQLGKRYLICCWTACLAKIQPVQVSAILEVTESGHGFLLQVKDNYRLKAQSPFVPEPLIKRFGLKDRSSCSRLYTTEDAGSQSVQF
jgi:transcription termination factor Rho